MHFAPYADGDLDGLTIQPAQASALADHDALALSLSGGPVWTIRADDGRVLWIGGFLVWHEGHASAWCLLADAIGSAMFGVTRICRVLIAAARWQRLDMAIRRDFAASVRWAGQLGFEREGVLQGVPDHDVYIYRRAG